jgi:hypothetical protein
MPHVSHPTFVTFHALRIKGFATVEALVDVTGHGADDVQSHLDGFLAAEHAQFREARKLWQITAPGKVVHGEQIAAERAAAADALAAVQSEYHGFLTLNEQFKELCTDWQLRNGEPNDHSDTKYDAKQIKKLATLDGAAQPIVSAFGSALARHQPYAPRLTGALGRLNAGDHKQFTGVMCNSYHDVWMELHEDLLLTLGIDRAAEGSF